jgi:hypothetical protein
MAKSSSFHEKMVVKILVAARLGSDNGMTIFQKAPK